MKGTTIFFYGLAIVFWSLCGVWIARHFSRRTRHGISPLSTRSFRLKPENMVLGLSVLICVVMLIPLFKRGLPLGIDISQHFFRVLAANQNLLDHVSVDAWSPYWDLGVDLFQFYSPLLFVLTNLLHVLSFQLLPLIVCFKLMIVVSYAALPAAVYWLARQFGVRPVAASLVALSVPACSTFYGMGIEALFGPGLLTQCFALNLFCTTLGFTVRIARGIRDKHADVLWLAFSLALLAMSHIISTTFFAVCTILLLLILLPNRHILGRLALACGLAVVLAAGTVWPTIHYIALRGPETGFGDTEFWSSFFSGAVFGPAILNCAALVGIIAVVTGFFRRYAARRAIHPDPTGAEPQIEQARPKNARLQLVLPSLILFTAFCASGKFGIHNAWIEFILPDQLFKQRAWPYLGIFLVVVSGFFYERILHGAHKLWRRTGVVVAICALALCIGGATGAKLIHLAPYVRVNSDLSGDSNRALVFDAFAWLHDNTPANSVLGVDERFVDVHMQGFGSFPAWVNIYADRYTVRGCQMELTRAHNADFLDHIAENPVEDTLHRLKRYNVSFVFTWNQDSVAVLQSRPDLFTRVFSNGLVSIFQVEGHDFRYLASDIVRISDFSFSEERVSWRLDSNGQTEPLVAAIAWHPRWHVLVDRVPTAIQETDDHLISFHIPPSGTHEIVLDYGADWTEIVFSFVSLLGWVALLGGIALRISGLWVQRPFSE